MIKMASEAVMANTDISSSKSVFLPNAEPEFTSINFRQSLKFFQEQLVLNGKSFPAPNHVKKVNAFGKYALVNIPGAQNKNSTPGITHKNEVFNDDIKDISALNSCQIKIPTVDSILESVRILRAIQKSQEERNALRSLESCATNSMDNSQTFDSLSSFTDIDGNYSFEVPFDHDSNNKVNEMLIENFNAQQFSTINFSSSVNNICSFWPSNTLLAEDICTNKEILEDIEQCIKEKQIINSKNTLESTTNNKTNENEQNNYQQSRINNSSEKANTRNLESDFEREQNSLSTNTYHEGIEDQTDSLNVDDNNLKLNISQENLKAQYVIAFVTEPSSPNPNNIDMHSKLSKTYQSNYISEEPSTKKSSTDGDSGIYRSPIFGSSPTSPYRMDSCSDTCSSLYVSAESSPCPSLSSLLDTSLGFSSYITNPVSDSLETEYNDNMWEDILQLSSKETKEQINDPSTVCDNDKVCLESVMEQKHLDDTKRSAQTLSKIIFEDDIELIEPIETKEKNYEGSTSCDWLDPNIISHNEMRIPEQPPISANVTNTEDNLNYTDITTNALKSPDIVLETLSQPTYVPDIMKTKLQSNDLLIEREDFLILDNSKETILNPAETNRTLEINDISEAIIAKETILNHEKLNSTVGVNDISEDIIANETTLNHTKTNGTIKMNDISEDIIANQTILNHIKPNGTIKIKDIFEEIIANETILNTAKPNPTTETNNISEVIRAKETVSNHTIPNPTFEIQSISDEQESHDSKYFTRFETTLSTKDDLTMTTTNYDLSNMEDEHSFSSFTSIDLILSGSGSKEHESTKKIENCEKTPEETFEYPVSTNKHFETVESKTQIEIIENKETDVEIRHMKITSASWDMLFIMESLYGMKEYAEKNVPYEEKQFEKEIYILSKGAFFNHPEGIYTVSMHNSSLQIMSQDSQVLFSIMITHSENIAQDQNILMVDNKMGRCLYFQFDSYEDLTEVKEAIDLYRSQQWQIECIKIVHYPLKCHQDVIIIDLGSCSTRAGILMDQPTLPMLFFPTICAKHKITGNCVYGMEALHPEVRQNSNLSFPVRLPVKMSKYVMDVDVMEGFFKKIFTDLQVDPTKFVVQLCLPRSINVTTQSALVKLLLEHLKVKAVTLTNQAILSLYAHDVSTAVIVNIGERMDILPVVDGFKVETGVTELPYGGQRIIHHMKHALAAKHISLSSEIDSFLVQYIMENSAYIAMNFENETEIAIKNPDVIKKTINIQKFIIDNSVKEITVDEARFKITEGLFKPEMWGLDIPGVHQLVAKAIQATGVDARKKVAESIYVSGGVTMIPGFVERLSKEVAKISKNKVMPKVFASNYRYHCAYIGSCKFAKMKEFPQVCIDLEEYTKNSIQSLKKFVL